MPREAISKGCILYNFIYVTFWKRQKYRERAQISGCQDLGRGGEGFDCSVHMREFGGELMKPKVY